MIIKPEDAALDHERILLRAVLRSLQKKNETEGEVWTAALRVTEALRRCDVKGS